MFNALNQHIETWTGTGSDPSTATTRTDYAYDALGRLTTVTVLRLNGATLSTPLVTSYAYDADNNLVNEQLPNGVTMNYSYNHLNYLTDLVETNSEGETLLSEHYTLNLDGTHASVASSSHQSNQPSVKLSLGGSKNRS